MRRLAALGVCSWLLGCGGSGGDRPGEERAALSAPLVEHAKLTLSPPDFAQFGRSVGLSGGTLVVGSYYATGASAQVFVNSGTGWSKQSDLIPSDLVNGDGYGEAATVDGDIAAVGAPFLLNGPVSEGVVYVYVRTGASWSLQQQLTPGSSGKLFGRALSVSGNTLMVGSASGTHVFVRSGSAWTLEQMILTSASSVSLQGNVAVLGIPNSHSNEGRVEVWLRTGTSWSMEQSLAASDQTPQDRFGQSVSLDGDRFVAGAFGNDDAGEASGALYVFERSGGTWAEQQKLVASDASEGAYLGVSVALHGDLLVGGAHSESSLGLYAGAAYLYTRTGTTWTEQQKLVASDAGDGDGFGNALAMTNDWLAVGADDERAVYMFSDAPTAGGGASGSGGATGGSGGSAAGGSGGVPTGGSGGLATGGAAGVSGSPGSPGNGASADGGCGCRVGGGGGELTGVFGALFLALSLGFNRCRQSSGRRGRVR